MKDDDFDRIDPSDRSRSGGFKFFVVEINSKVTDVFLFACGRYIGPVLATKLFWHFCMSDYGSWRISCRVKVPAMRQSVEYAVYH